METDVTDGSTVQGGSPGPQSQVPQTETEYVQMQSMNRVMTQTHRFISGVKGQLEVTQKELDKKIVDIERLKGLLETSERRLANEMLERAGLRDELAKATELCEALKPHKSMWKGHKVSVPPYDGTTDWTLFLQSFRAKARLAKWSEEEMCLELQVALQGTAARVLADAHLEEGTFEEMVSAVAARFAPKEKRIVWNEEWKLLRQAEGEDVDDYATTFKSLYEKAYPDEPLEVDGVTPIVKILQFVDGLYDPKVRRDVLIQQCQNIEQIITKVRLCQCVDKQLEMRYGEAAEVVSASEVDEVVEEKGGGTELQLQSPQYDAPGVLQTQGELKPDILPRQGGQGHGQGHDQSRDIGPVGQGQIRLKRCNRGLRKRKGRGQGRGQGQAPGESQGQGQRQDQSGQIGMAKVETQLAAMQATLASIASGCMEGQVESQLAATLPTESNIEGVLHPLNCQGLTCWSVDQSQKTVKMMY